MFVPSDRISARCSLTHSYFTGLPTDQSESDVSLDESYGETYTDSESEHNLSGGIPARGHGGIPIKGHGGSSTKTLAGMLAEDHGAIPALVHEGIPTRGHRGISTPGRGEMVIENDERVPKGREEIISKDPEGMPKVREGIPRGHEGTSTDTHATLRQGHNEGHPTESRDPTTLRDYVASIRERIPRETNQGIDQSALETAKKEKISGLGQVGDHLGRGEIPLECDPSNEQCQRPFSPPLSPESPRSYHEPTILKNSSAEKKRRSAEKAARKASAEKEKERQTEAQLKSAALHTPIVIPRRLYDAHPPIAIPSVLDPSMGEGRDEVDGFTSAHALSEVLPLSTNTRSSDDKRTQRTDSGLKCRDEVRKGGLLSSDSGLGCNEEASNGVDLDSSSNSVEQELALIASGNLGASLDDSVSSAYSDLATRLNDSGEVVETESLTESRLNQSTGYDIENDACGPEVGVSNEHLANIDQLLAAARQSELIGTSIDDVTPTQSDDRVDSSSVVDQSEGANLYKDSGLNTAAEMAAVDSLLHFFSSRSIDGDSQSELSNEKGVLGSAERSPSRSSVDHVIRASDPMVRASDQVDGESMTSRFMLSNFQPIAANQAVPPNDHLIIGNHVITENLSTATEHMTSNHVVVSTAHALPVLSTANHVTSDHVTGGTAHRTPSSPPEVDDNANVTERKRKYTTDDVCCPIAKRRKV